METSAGTGTAPQLCAVNSTSEPLHCLKDVLGCAVESHSSSRVEKGCHMAQVLVSTVNRTGMRYAEVKGKNMF